MILPLIYITTHMKLSIIIPAYNAETYIESCLSSCCNQDLKTTDYEILVINDGSTDCTEDKVSAFINKHPNVKIKSQKNLGNGAARNTGVSISKGKYIYFLDADDYISKNTLGTLITLIEDNRLDIIGFSSKHVTDDSFVNSKNSMNEIKINVVSNGIDFLGSNNYIPEVWWYIINKQFYDKSKSFFYDRKFVQDAYFTPTLISKAEKIAFIPYDVHRYRVSNNSITRDKSDKHLYSHMQDMCFSVNKVNELRKNLMEKGITNNMALLRLQAKQQRYVFIIITRFIRSNLEISILKKILLNFKTIESYPLDKFLSIPDYKSKLNIILTFIYNRNYLLYPIMKVYRLIRRN